MARIPDTLVFAMEFIMLATPSEQGPALEELRKEILRAHSELKVRPPEPNPGELGLEREKTVQEYTSLKSSVQSKRPGGH